MTLELEAVLESKRLPFIRSLRGKSILFLTLLFTYSLLLAVFVLYQKASLLGQLAAIDQLQQQENALVEADLAAFGAITELFVMAEPGGRQMVLNKVHDQFTQLQQRYAGLLQLYPDRATDFREMLRSLADTLVRPTPDNMLTLRNALAANKRELDELLARNRIKNKQAIDTYLAQSDRVAQISLLFAGIGLGLLGWIVAIFFRKQVGDIEQVQLRVGQIVDGYRGEPLQSNRDDELGELIGGVNQMASRLRQREQELEIERHKQFHVDKMGTIGHMAAGIVHEVGNPVAAILGLARECQESLRQPDAGIESARNNLEMIVEYTERLGRITEDMAAFNRPRQATAWMDLNELVRSIDNLLHYDERWYGILLEKQLASQLPAIMGDSDQLSQVLMNLVVNAFEAIEMQRPEQPFVRIETAVADDGVILRVSDNGCGLTQEQQERAFDAFYTTKQGKGSGLGLLLCSSIISGHDGYMRLLPNDDQGLTVEVFLPRDSKRLALGANGEPL
ncbi:MAG: ATP-binding protein [Halopseudomonas sp.]